MNKLRVFWCWHFHARQMILIMRHTRPNTNDFVIELECPVCRIIHNVRHEGPIGTTNA